MLLTAQLGIGCAHSGVLSDDALFDDSRTLFPEAYAACDRGEAAACAGLASKLKAWSSDAEHPATLALYGIACSRGSTEACVELAIAKAQRNPSANPKLLRYCVSHR